MKKEIKLGKEKFTDRYAVRYKIKELPEDLVISLFKELADIKKELKILTNLCQRKR